MTVNVKDILILVTALQLLIFALAILVQGKFRIYDQLFLGIFFLSLAFNIFNYFLFQHIQFFLSTPIVHVLYAGSPFAFAYAPALYLYLRFSIRPVQKLMFKHLLHFVPFLALAMYIFFFFTILPISSKREILIQSSLFGKSIYTILVACIHLQVLVYSIIFIREIVTYIKHLKNLYTSKEKLNFTWLLFIFGAIFCLWLLDLSRFVFTFFSESLKLILESILFTGFLIFCYLFLYKAMSIRFTQKDEDIKPENKKQSLSFGLKKIYEQKLTQYMKVSKPYLDPDLNLYDLSKLVSIPPRSLSEVLNSSFQQNFYDYINSYRIKESEQLFRSSLEADKTILEVLYEVGFNSKSSFNTAFKKLTGMTPTEYRRNHQLSNLPQKQVV